MEPNVEHGSSSSAQQNHHLELLMDTVELFVAVVVVVEFEIMGE